MYMRSHIILRISFFCILSTQDFLKQTNQLPTLAPYLAKKQSVDRNQELGHLQFKSPPGVLLFLSGNLFCLILQLDFLVSQPYRTAKLSSFANNHQKGSSPSSTSHSVGEASKSESEHQQNSKQSALIGQESRRGVVNVVSGSYGQH